MKTGIMEVTVARAKGLKQTEFCVKIKPYVVLQYKNEQQKSTTGPRASAASPKRFMACFCLSGQGNSPVWNESFKFKVNYPEEGEDNKHNKLILKIMDHDFFTDDDYLGQATIYLKEVIEIGLEKGQAELPLQKYRVVSKNLNYRGEIQVGVTFTATRRPDEKQEAGHMGSESTITV